MTDRDFRKDLFYRVRLGRSGTYLEANGAKFYYETYGQGEPLLLFHGGMSSLDTFRFQIADLAEQYRLIIPERRGHGHTPDTPGEFSYESMADDMAAFMDRLSISKARMLGYSDGANLILYLARKRPDLVERFVSIGGNFHHQGSDEEFQKLLREIPADSTGEETIDRNYEKYSPDGPEHYVKVFQKVKRLWLEEPVFRAEDLAEIQAPGFIVAGDRDCILPEHTLEFFRALPCARLCMLPDTSHGLLKERPGWINPMILEFLNLPVDAILSKEEESE